MEEFIPIAFFIMIGAIVIVPNWLKSKERKEMQATLRSAIEKASEGNHELPFMISADGNAPHQAVVTVMDVAGQMGFQNLSISTRQPEQK